MQKYEYKFVSIGAGMVGIRTDIRGEYQMAVAQEAKEGWRLVQLFAPATGRAYGRAIFCDAIFERPVN